MLMNIGLGLGACEERESERGTERDGEREREQKVGGWRRIMDFLLTNALPEVVVVGLKRLKVREGGEKTKPDHTKIRNVETKVAIEHKD